MAANGPWRVLVLNDDGSLPSDTITQIVNSAGIQEIVDGIPADVNQAIDTANIPGLVAIAISLQPVVPGLAHSDPEYAIPITDNQKYVAGGVLRNGSVQFVNLLHQLASIPFAAFNSSVPIQPVRTDPDFAVPIYDAQGYIAGGWTKDGRLVQLGGTAFGELALIEMANRNITLTRSFKKFITIIGDSLSRGFGPAADWLYSEAWPGQMALEANWPTGITVNNLATSGWTIDEQCIKFGSLKLAVTVTGNDIPASGSVAVTIPAGIGWIPNGGRSFTGTLYGVPGTLTRAGTDTTALTFTRTTAGSVVTVPAGTNFVSSDATHFGDTVVIYVGRNDINNNISGIHANVADHVVIRSKELVDSLTPQVKQVLLLGTTTGTNETLASTGVNATNYARVVEVNRRLARDVPGHFYDLRAYLVKQAIYDQGIAVVEGDASWVSMQNDGIPAAIMIDLIHYTKTTAHWVGVMIGRWLIERGWV